MNSGEKKELEIRVSPRNSVRAKADSRGRVSLGSAYSSRRIVVAVTRLEEELEDVGEVKTPEVVRVPLSRVVEGETDARGRLNMGSAFGGKAVVGVVLSVEETYELEVSEEAVEVSIAPAGETVRFPRRSEIAGYGPDRLLAVYVVHGAVVGAYALVEDEGQQFEGTLWFEGEPYNDFGDLDPFDGFGGTWQNKLEWLGAGEGAVLWRAEDQAAPAL